MKSRDNERRGEQQPTDKSLLAEYDLARTVFRT